MILRLGKKLLTANVLGVLFVLLALQLLSDGLAASLRDTDTRYLFPISLVGALAGLGCSRRKLGGIQALVLMAALGLGGVWIAGAGLFGPLVNLFKSLLAWIPHLNPALHAPMEVDTQSLVDAWNALVQASAALTARLQTWIFGFNRNVEVNDALIRNMIWIFVIWMFSAGTGWFAGRRNAIASLLPSLLLLAMVTAYSERNIENVWLLIAILLLLMGIWNYKNHTHRWEGQRIDYSESIGYDSGQAVVLFTLAIGFVALITPSISWRDIRDTWREWNQASPNEAAEMLGIQQQAVASGALPRPKPSLPRDHLLTGGYAQSQKIVMTISTGELPPIANPALIGAVPRYYWRSVTYDVYVGGGWVTSSAPPSPYDANTPLIPGVLDRHRLVHLDVRLIQPEGKLFWSGLLFSADIPFTADWRVRPQPSLFADQSALLEVDLFAAASRADSYQAQAYVPDVSEEELRAAGGDYPEGIRERYLSLPRSVPERVHQLAQDIVEGKASPYDKARAIEAYLRAYPYDLEVPAPPEDRDVADYFLFDLKRGYCDYYATAMVVLARSSGLPARFVSGYSSGSYDAPNAQYVVRELNAHSWVEVYFPQIGWVEFEPTGSQPEIDRLPEAISLPPQGREDSTASALLRQYRREMILVWVSPVLVLGCLALLYFTLIERWYYRRLSPQIAIDRIYQGLYRVGRPIAGGRGRGETAFEFSNRLTQKLDEIRDRSRFPNLVPQARDSVEELTNLYYRSLFSQQPAQKRDAIRALSIWRHVRVRLIATGVIRRITKVRSAP